MDTVERLRSMSMKKYDPSWAAWVQDQCTAAANEIERLREALAAANLERAELLAALEGVLPFLTGDYWPGIEADVAVDRAIAIARKAGAGAPLE